MDQSNVRKHNSKGTARFSTTTQVNLEQVNEKALHEKSCIATPTNLTREETTLSDLYKINNTSEISRNINDAVLHVIKKKMAQSKDPNKSISFKTGGPQG